MSKQRREQWRMILGKARQWARELSQELVERGIGVDKVLLFGSVARGDFTERYRLDNCVKRLGEILVGEEARSPLPVLEMGEKININPLTPRELGEEKEKSMVLRNASRYWIKLL